MPRYFFHVHDGRDQPDRIGVALADPREAQDQAITAVGEALKDLGAGSRHHPDWRMHVTDEWEATICDLRLRNQAGPG